MELLKGAPVSERVDRTVRSIIGDSGPRLAVYLIGADPSSLIYARSKERKGSSLGVDVVLREFGDDTEKNEVLVSLRSDAADKRVHGIMIERPLPDRFDMDELMNEVPPEKDVEGLHPSNLGSLFLGRPRFIPPTPLGALMVLRHYGIDIQGKNILIVGRSVNVGRPLSVLLSMKRDWANGTVTLAHSRTEDLKSHSIRSDILVTAVGRKGLINGDMLKENSVVIDLGINPLPGGIVGDVDIESAEHLDCMVTPTPGGTGPVTVSCMFLNLALAFAGGVNKIKSSVDPMIIEIYD
jgi:methylenetetrahydrofolate dehydrogenase (NADP+)/methenyltetrahydrofolate cyclohydrolase